MSSFATRFARRVAVAAAIVAASLSFVAPSAQADPLWPYGPDIPFVPMLPENMWPRDFMPQPACVPEVKMCVSKTLNLAWLMDNGRIVSGPWPMSHGRPGFETPVGISTVGFKASENQCRGSIPEDVPCQWSTLHNAPMPWGVSINGDIFTHVGPIPEQSHGCIRMSWNGAKATWDYLNVGDRVQILP